MKTFDRTYWYELNRSFLLKEIDTLKSRIESVTGIKASTLKTDVSHTFTTEEPAALEILCQLFNVTPFERDIILLCAAVELDSTMPKLLGELNGYRKRINPTFGLALSIFSDGHWSALAPDRPLRYRQIVHFGEGETLTTLPIRIDERILHYLTGWSSFDERLHELIHFLQFTDYDIPVYYREIETNLENLIGIIHESPSLPPVIQISGKDRMGINEIAYAACTHAGMNLIFCPSYAIPQTMNECIQFTKLLEREAMLTSSVLIIEVDGISNHKDTHNLHTLIDRFNGIIILSTPFKLYTKERDSVTFELPVLSAEQQYELWKKSMEGISENFSGQIPDVAAQFRLDPSAIRSISRELTYRYRIHGNDNNTLWDSCRQSTRGRLDDLAERIDSSVTWDDLVLPPQQKRQLRELAAQVRQRTKVYSTWGYAEKSRRGLAINALFAGPSGTGKTLAAEILANELNLDLYRIDLSAVVSKYIGETEKNLARIFDAAEGSGAVLLFDEADALFGKRSEVKDSHDRYANIEVGYLLQKMEAYRGLAILTTNMKGAIDTAFMRRIRFIVQFPFPDVQARHNIWEKVFPEAAPVKVINFTRLAKISLAGGSIRNIAVHSAFLAANNGNDITMENIVAAAVSELNKLEQPVPNHLTSISRKNNGQ